MTSNSMCSPSTPTGRSFSIAASIISLIAISLTSSTHFASGFGGGWGVTRTSNHQFSFLTLVPPKSSLSTTTALNARRRGRPQGPLRTFVEKPTMNEEIEHETLRVVVPNPKGKDDSLGVLSKEEALEKARESGLDLILINANADPPVCKIVDYSKYRYMKEKKAKEVKKNSKASEVKEVKMSYKIDIHDYETRKKNAAKFISKGNRVKFVVMFKGREVQHDDLGRELLVRMADDLDEICSMEGKPKREGRSLSCMVSPKPHILKAINEKKRAEERALRKQREESRIAMEEEKAAKEDSTASTKTILKNDDDEDDDDDDKSIDELMKGDRLMKDLFD